MDNAHPLRRTRRQMECEGVLDRIVLPRFDRSTVAQIARYFCVDGEDVESATTRLYEQSEGVPLFLDEAIHGESAGGPGQRLNVPQRIERLGESTLTLLEIAAVAGVGFNLDLLCEVTGWPEADVLRELDELVRARFVHVGKRRRFGNYSFSHHLVYAAVYDAIPEQSRRSRHLLVARASQRLYETHGNRAAEIASHYERAGDATNAASAHAVAASHALQLYANEEALAHAERGLALNPDTRLSVTLQTARAQAAQSLGRSNILAEAIDRLDELQPPSESLPEVERLKTTSALHEGRLDVARKAGRRYLRAARANHDTGNIFQAYLENSAVAIASDRYERAQAYLRRAKAILPAGNDAALLRFLRLQTYMAQRRGLHDDVLAQTAAWLLTESRRVGDPETEAEALLRLGHVAMAEQRFAEAFSCYDAAREAYRRFGSPRGVSTIDLNAANAALWSANYGEARVLYEKCLSFARENEAQAHRLVSAIGLTLADIYTGHLARAQITIRSVAALALGTQKLEEANWHLCCALIAAESGEYLSAASSYDAALAIHRLQPVSLLYAITIALATLTSLDSGDNERSAALGAELLRLPEELLVGEEFPHLMLWAKARLAKLSGDESGYGASLAASARVYHARVQAIGSTAAVAYADVPWNARFLIELAL